MGLDEAIRKLRRAACSLAEGQGRIARRNARRRVFGALRSFRNLVQSRYPAVSSDRPEEDAIDRAARKEHWKAFEYKVVKHVGRDWDPDFAQSFADHVTSTKGVRRREIAVVDLRGRFLGRCNEAQIQLRGSLSGDEWWRTLIHELAHAIEEKMPGNRSSGTHRRRFVLAMAEVYRMWREFLRQGKAAADRGPGGR